MYDSKDAHRDLALMEIAIENARKRRDPSYVPNEEDLEKMYEKIGKYHV